jgi:hypothetical protein
MKCSIDRKTVGSGVTLVVLVGIAAILEAHPYSRQNPYYVFLYLKWQYREEACTLRQDLRHQDNNALPNRV